MHAVSVALIINPVTGHVSPQYHVVYDETFLTVSHMIYETIPPNWDEMCKNSVESATSGAFDLVELWFKQLTDTSEDHVTNPSVADSGGWTLNSKGSANKPNLTKNSEGENKVAADAIARKSLPNVSSMTRSKGVSYADVKYGITKPSFPPTNEGDQIKMPKLVNILQSGFHRSERIWKSQDAKESEESHPKNRNTFTAKISLAFYTVLSIVCTQYTSMVMDPKPGSVTYDKLINGFHEANELYDGTLNQLNLSVFATSPNGNYTYPQAMQQTYKDKFVGAMAVEVAARKERDHWKMVPR